MFFFVVAIPRVRVRGLVYGREVIVGLRWTILFLGRRMNHNLDPPVGGVCRAETRRQLALAAAIRLEQGAVEAALGYQVIDHGLGTSLLQRLI